jgi:fatty acid desaturase
VRVSTGDSRYSNGPHKAARRLPITGPNEPSDCHDALLTSAAKIILDGKMMDLQTSTQTLANMPNAHRAKTIQRRVAIDSRANWILLSVVAASILLEFTVWPYLLTRFGAAILWLALPLVLLAPTHWGLIHEAIHGQLHRSRRVNELLGRSLSIAYWLPFDAVRFGHLMHHRFTREPYDRPDVHDVATHRIAARLTYYMRLLGGLYIAELAIPLLAFIPPAFAARIVARNIGAEGPSGNDVQRLFVGFSTNADRRRRIRRDWLVSVGVHLLALHLYGKWWPALVTTMYLRGVWLSLADNLPHYDVSIDEPQRARNFRVPAIWRPILMNHHLHQLHHRYPTLPWTALPALSSERNSAQASSLDSGASYFGAALRQFQRFGKAH